MNGKGDFVYIMYPIPVEEIGKLSLPFFKDETKKVIPMENEQDFMPLWYGNASFPEDEIY